MTASDETEWRAVRSAYEAGGGSVSEICARFEVTSGQLYRRMKVESWKPRRPARRGTAQDLPSFRQASNELKRVLGAEIAPIPQNLDPDNLSGDEQAPQIYIKRIYGLVAHQISLIEARRSDFGIGQEAQSTSDTERMSRTLSVLVRAIEKLIELEANIGAPETVGQEGQPQLDAEQFCIELIRRMAKFERAGPDAVPEDPDGQGT